jgi:hypothetical protein
MTTSEKQKLRNKAQRYAVAFLMQKYRTEYKELYRAYLINRGAEIHDLEPLVDERKLIKKNESRVVRTAPDGSLFLGDN